MSTTTIVILQVLRQGSFPLYYAVETFPPITFGKGHKVRISRFFKCSRNAFQSLVIFSLSFCVLAPCSVNGEDAAVAIGISRPTWHNLPCTQGNLDSLTDHASFDVVVVALTCNHCPVAAAYYDRMNEFVKRHSAEERVTLLAVSVSHQESDKLPRMKQIAEQNKFQFAYLYDASQQIGKSFGGTITPEFFVLNKNRVLVYRGAWDDNNNPAKVSIHYVEDAVEAALRGEVPSTTSTTARGCLVTYADSP